MGFLCLPSLKDPVFLSTQVGSVPVLTHGLLIETL